MKCHRRVTPLSLPSSAFTGFRFPPEIILLAVRWYLRFGLSYRDLEELFAERGVAVDHVTVHRWVQRFTPLVIDAARPCRHTVGRRWFVDETYVNVAGVWRYVYRAVDGYGQVIDVYISRRRDIAAARTFFTTAIAGHGQPEGVVTDRAAALAAELDRELEVQAGRQHVLSGPGTPVIEVVVVIGCNPFRPTALSRGPPDHTQLHNPSDSPVENVPLDLNR